jgi:hypothetical protein
MRYLQYELRAKKLGRNHDYDKRESDDEYGGNNSNSALAHPSRATLLAYTARHTPRLLCGKG